VPPIEGCGEPQCKRAHGITELDAAIFGYTQPHFFPLLSFCANILKWSDRRKGPEYTVLPLC
jgi:hypothetical protein